MQQWMVCEVVPPERVDPVSGCSLDSICKDKGHYNGDHGVLSKEQGRGYGEGNARESDNTRSNKLRLVVL